MNDKVMYLCFICSKNFQMGPNKYDGKFMASYNISVCRTCYEGNWDGWAPQYEQRLIAHLEKNGLEIPGKNEKGLLPRE